MRAHSFDQCEDVGGEELGAAVRTRLAGFICTLRDNGFKVGLAEAGDALRVLAAPGLARPSAVKPALRALLCGRRSDWDAFDALFDAFWLGRGVKSRVALPGAVPGAKPSLGSPVPSGSVNPGPAADVTRGDGETDADAAPSGRLESLAALEPYLARL
jgi:uncharacterized protein